MRDQTELRNAVNWDILHACIAAMAIIFCLSQAGCSRRMAEEVPDTPRTTASGIVWDQAAFVEGAGFAPADAEKWTRDERRAIDMAHGVFQKAMGARRVVPRYKVEGKQMAYIVSIMWIEYAADGQQLAPPAGGSIFVVEVSRDLRNARMLPSA